MALKLKKIINIASKVFWGIVWAIFGLLCVLIIWLAVDKFIVGSPVPSVLGYASLTIETGSMNGFSAMAEGAEPKQVAIGDMIIIKKTNNYKIGDVVTFLQPGDKIPTTHRIINIDSNGDFVTKGDANNTKDTLPLKQEHIIGEVILHLPKLGQFTGWVKAEGWIYLVCGLAILAIGSFVLKSDDDEELVEESAGETKGEVKKVGELNSENGESLNETSVESSVENKSETEG